MLEDLLKPIKALDEEVLRQYTKLSQKYHLDEGKKKYAVGYGFGVVGFTFYYLLKPHFPYISYLELPMDHPIFTIGSSTLLFGTMVDSIHTGYGMFFKSSLSENTNIKTVDKFESLCKKITTPLRLPTLLYSGFNAAMAISEIYTAVHDNKSFSPESYFYLEESIFFASMASSMYIKDTDPKLLQKDPLWKRMYTGAKEKVSALIPHPAPQPHPIPLSYDRSTP